MYLKNRPKEGLCSFFKKYYAFTGSSGCALILTLLCCGSLLLPINAYSQPVPAGKAAIAPAIGEVIPVTLQGRTMRAGIRGEGRVQLSDYRGKLLILDFWATWCTSCLENFPRLDSLRKNAGGRMDVLLVNTLSTGDTPARVADFFTAGLKKGNTYPFPTIISDTTFTAYFPHKLLPHYVWIGPDGTLLATTEAEQLTLENVNRVFAKKSAAIEIKKDMDRSKPLLFAGDGVTASLEHYSILLRGHIPGLGAGSTERRENGLVRGRMKTNVSIKDLYLTAFTGLREHTSDKLFRVEVRDSSCLFREKSPLPESEWNQVNEYSYDLLVPAASAPRLYNYMLDDLNNNLPYNGYFEKRNIPCISIYLKGKPDLLVTKGGDPGGTLYSKQGRALVNRPMNRLSLWLDEMIPGIAIVDRTRYTGNIDIRVPDNVHSPEEIRALLQTYGIELRNETRDLELFILSDKISPHIPSTQP